MDIAYFRSSSYNCFDLCQQQYFLQYVLGWDMKVGKAATKGTIVHKALEILAKAKLADQNKKKTITDDVTGRISIKTYQTNKFVDNAINKSFDFYVKKEQPDFTDKERREITRWTYKVIDDGFYDPRNLTIIHPEQKFDLPIKLPWAKLSNGKYLRVKGTIDLIIKSGNYYEIVDWKTGARKDWKTGDYKTAADLDDDFQLRLYHYAIQKLYPDIDTVLVTINYINSGGPYTATFDNSNIEIVEAKMHNQFIKIKNCTHPRLKGNGKHWFCNRVCSYGKNLHKTGKSECEYASRYLKYNGMQSAVADLTKKGFKIDYYEDPG